MIGLKKQTEEPWEYMSVGFGDPVWHPRRPVFWKETTLKFIVDTQGETIKLFVGTNGRPEREWGTLADVYLTDANYQLVVFLQRSNTNLRIKNFTMDLY